VWWKDARRTLVLSRWRRKLPCLIVPPNYDQATEAYVQVDATVPEVQDPIAEPKAPEVQPVVRPAASAELVAF